MPIGADLVLHEESDPDTVRNQGDALGRVIEKTATRWKTPLAIPLMDLRLEKIDLVARVGVSQKEAEAFHFTAPLDDETVVTLCGRDAGLFCPGSVARDQALAYIASIPGLLPIGMTIGPFSLVTRLMADPIAAAAMSGSGISPEDSGEVHLLMQCLQIAEATVERSIRSQVAHGARAIMICEPAANTAFLSPRQLRAGSSVFERLVMQPNLRLNSVLEELGCDLIFHNCGELIDAMVEAFAQRFHPVVLSLGSSRKLWEDARLVPADVVLYGNLPTKSFYSDGAMPVAEVIRRAEALVAKMKACGHPHILGSECDVLFVPEACDAILKKVDAMMAVTAPAAPLLKADS
ncbi:MAG: uroporphyrinogen decarboxylase family protein [Terracidiphilus sp.]|jgi:hypothetical protein